MSLWGSRFEEQPSDVLWRYTVSHADHRLLEDDIAGSVAHVTMLGETGILGAEEAGFLLEGLGTIGDEAAAGSFRFLDADEDVHSAVERRLGELVGDVAGKLHTARSRNDQVALDLRLYLRRSVAELTAALRRMVAVLVDKAEEVGSTVVPSYTHLQQAQAVPLAHHLLAHAWKSTRDVARFEDALLRIAVSPLGAGAGGGTSLPIDVAAAARELGMPATFKNSLDAVAARDFASEYTFCCVQAMVHLSRLAEEMILWTSTEFGWVTFSDAHTTGSSAMPHKKNPDIAELARGKAAGAIGDLTALLALQKGLPLAYNRDLQEDKETVFRAGDTLGGTVEAMTQLMAGAVFDPPASSSWVTALDLAEVLVGRGVPFRSAHEAVGELVARLLEEGRTLGDVTPDDLAATHPAFDAADISAVDPARSVAARQSAGGGSMDSVAAQIAALREWLDADPG